MVRRVAEFSRDVCQQYGVVNRLGDTGIGQFDYKAHYLAYHEGAGGYLKGTYKSKRWLVDVAGNVAQQAARYEAQIAKCGGLRERFLGIF